MWNKAPWHQGLDASNFSLLKKRRRNTWERGMIWTEMCFKHHSAFLFFCPAWTSSGCPRMHRSPGSGRGRGRSTEEFILPVWFGVRKWKGMVQQHRQAWMDFWLNRHPAPHHRYEPACSRGTEQKRRMCCKPGRRARSHKCALIPWIIWFRLSEREISSSLLLALLSEDKRGKIQEKYAADYLKWDVLLK